MNTQFNDAGLPPEGRPRLICPCPRLICPCTSCRFQSMPGDAFPTAEQFQDWASFWGHMRLFHLSDVAERDRIPSSFALITASQLVDLTFIAAGHGYSFCRACPRLAKQPTGCEPRRACRRTVNRARQSHPATSPTFRNDIAAPSHALYSYNRSHLHAFDAPVVASPDSNLWAALHDIVVPVPVGTRGARNPGSDSDDDGDDSPLRVPVRRPGTLRHARSRPNRNPPPMTGVPRGTRAWASASVTLTPPITPAPVLAGSPSHPPGSSAPVRDWNRTPLSSLPALEDILACPLRTDDLYLDLPGPARASFELLTTKLLRNVALAPSGSDDKARAYHVLMILPFVVARRTLRGESGFGARSARLLALQDRIRRALRDDSWALLWQEMLFAVAARDAWRHERQRFRAAAAAATPRGRARARALRLSKLTQYGRATAALAQAAVLLPDTPGVLEKMKALHPAPPETVQPIPGPDLPPHVKVLEEQVLRAVRAMDCSSAGGPDRMPARWLRLVATSEQMIAPGVSALSILTKVVSKMANGDVPSSVAQFISAASLVAEDRGGGKPRPIAIGNVLRCLTAKVLLPEAIANTSAYLQ